MPAKWFEYPHFFALHCRFNAYLGSEALAHEGVMVIGLLLALVALWVTSALPLGVTALIIVVLCPVLSIVGKWMSAPNATVVALVGFSVMFFLGMQLLI